MKTLEERVAELEFQMKMFQTSSLQVRKNNSAILNSKTDPSFSKIPQIDSNTSNIELNSEDIVSTQEGLAETYEEMNASITEVEEALAEVYEIVIGTDEE